MMQLNIIKQEYLLAGQFKCRRLYSHVALLLHEYLRLFLIQIYFSLVTLFACLFYFSVPVNYISLFLLLFLLVLLFIPMYLVTPWWTHFVCAHCQSWCWRRCLLCSCRAARGCRAAHGHPAHTADPGTSCHQTTGQLSDI